jgi:hypothetical protein
VSYNVHFQTDPSYKNVKYGRGTVYSSGCGPAALCNALDALGIAKVTVKTMCAYAVSVGARVTGGTDESVLLKHAAKKYGFTYRTTSKNAELLAHLKAGGVAILHGGSSHQLFSTSGHFVCAVKASGETITVLDSYWYSGKYTSTDLRRKKVKVLDNGVITTSLYQCGLATADRSPSYYLISKKTEQKPQKPASSNTTTDKKQEDDDMNYYKKFENIPTWYQAAVKKAIDAGALNGTGNGELNVSEDLCRTLTVLNNMGVLDKK